MLHYSIEEAIEYRQQNKKLIGSIFKSLGHPLLKLIIIQKTPTEFGLMWADQRSSFEDEDNSKIISDEDFDRQMKDCEKLNLYCYMKLNSPKRFFLPFIF